MQFRINLTSFETKSLVIIKCNFVKIEAYHLNPIAVSNRLPKKARQLVTIKFA